MRGFQPRRGQREIMQYRGGRMGVAAVPGSGKTTTITVLAAELLQLRARGEGPLAPNGEVLIVTYQNAAVDTLRSRIAQELMNRGLPRTGYDIRTLHSLSYGIVQTYPGHAGTTADFRVLDDRRQRELVDRAVLEWNADNTAIWGRLAPGDSGYYHQRWESTWSRIAGDIARSVIATAKNLRLTPSQLQARLEVAAGSGAGDPTFLGIGPFMYNEYQKLVETSGAIDFNDMVRLAVDLLEGHGDLCQRLGERWSVVLEDEAQDSVPLQEELLQLVTSRRGNWIRVGDPNQAITSTFTAADPAFLRRFLERDDVVAIEMAISGRSAHRIMDLANFFVRWTRSSFPVTAVRERAFREQQIQPTEEGDAQTNPDDRESAIAFRVYEERSREIADTAYRALRFSQENAEQTLAVLVPTNAVGFEVAELLRDWDVEFDERLRSSATTRSVVDTLAGVLTFLGDPLSSRHIGSVHDALTSVQSAPDGGDSDRIGRLLRSCYRPEALLYPDHGATVADAFPPVEMESEELAAIGLMVPRLRDWVEASAYPVDQLTMAVAQDLLTAGDLTRAHEAALFLRGRADNNPSWRLPELAMELKRAAASGALTPGDDDLFEPCPGRISLTTMHRAKGLEWDLVYALGVDGLEFPDSTEGYFRGFRQHLGGNPAEIAKQELYALFSEGNGRDSVGVDPTASQVAFICERLRLLYVTLTRARRYLSVSYSRSIPQAQRTRQVDESVLFKVLRNFTVGRHQEEARKEPPR
ncbi:MAG: ATP-dependent helicase [Candidatus Latescibacterota bacterium]|nr:ATP-dependent helicase [Candidatus Latescibacterota bacterium]